MATANTPEAKMNEVLLLKKQCTYAGSSCHPIVRGSTYKCLLGADSTCAGVGGVAVTVRREGSMGYTVGDNY